MAKKKNKTVASTKKVEIKEVSTTEQKETKKKKGLLARRKEKKVSKSAKKEAKASHKEHKEKIQKESPRGSHPGGKKTPSSIRRQKMKGGILMLIGFATLIFVGYFLFGKFFKPQDLAEILPAEKTVAVLELSTDITGGQVQQFHTLMENYAVYQKEGVIALIESTFPVDFETEIQPWLGRKIGLALLVNPTQGNFEPLFFIESIDHKLTLEFLESRALDIANEELKETSIENHTVYQFEMSQEGAFTFINNYLVIAPTSENMEAYISAYISTSALSDDQDFRKVANNLPQGGIAFGYANLNKLFDTLEKDELFIVQKGQDLLAMRPFLDVFKAEGISIFAESDRLVAQTFTSIDNEALDGENYITFNERYEGELLQLINEEPIFLSGGHDLTKELNRIEDIFKSGTKTPALVFEGLIEAQKQRYLGEDVSLKEDIYPLFTGEYLITIENSLESPIVSLLMKLTDNGGSVALFDKVMSEFIKVSGVFSPRVQEVELPDGTMGKEIVASPEKIERSTSTHEGTTITSLKLGDTGIAIHYAILDQIVAMSTKQENLKLIIDRYEGDLEEGLTTSKYYDRNLKPVLRTADQVMHVKLGALTQVMGLNEDSFLQPYLVPFNNFTVTKNFFEDGISTTYLVEVI